MTGPSQFPQSGIWSGNKIVWSLTTLFSIFLLASIFSVDSNFSFWGSPYRGGGFITFAFYFIFALLTFILLKKPFDTAQGEAGWKKIWGFSIFIGILVSLVAVIQYYGLFRTIFFATGERPGSTMGNPIMLATYILLLFFITLSFAIKEKVKFKKIFYVFSSVLFFYVILITGSRGAYLGLLIGSIYFLLFFPKKMALAKIGVVAVLIAMCGFVFYINTTNQYPKILQENKLFNSVASRLSLRSVLSDPRFYTWTGIDYKILIEKPILGYGPENFAVGFDKYYDPSIPYIGATGEESWWDRAHNVIIQTASDAGIFALLVYLVLFVILFWKLQTLRLRSGQENDIKIIAAGIQATLISYLVANFFSFDSFSTYLIFFLLIAYSLYLISSNNAEATQNLTRNDAENKKPWWKGAIIIILFFILIIFLWQYNFAPFQINTQINKASDLVNRKQCNQAFMIMDKILQQHSFLDSYVITEYIIFEKKCSEFYPENNLAYTKKGLELLTTAVKIQPLYTRYWIYLGNLATILADLEADTTTKNNLVKQASNYFDKALQLAPKHQEILTGKAKLEIVAGNFMGAQNYSEDCIALNKNLGDCYWYLALSEIYLKNSEGVKKNMQLASDNKYNINSEASLIELANAYGSFPDYQNLAPVFEKLVAINPNNVEYKATLNLIYSKLGK